MSKNVSKILEKIQALEIEREKLLPLRKEEILKILEHNNGLILDNQLLAGLAIYAANPSNAGSNLLRELSQLGKTKIPSGGRSRVSSKKNNTSNFISTSSSQKGQAHG
jgi:hypothetical protein